MVSLALLEVLGAWLAASEVAMLADSLVNSLGESWLER